MDIQCSGTPKSILKSIKHLKLLDPELRQNDSILEGFHCSYIVMGYANTYVHKYKHICMSVSIHMAMA